MKPLRVSAEWDAFNTPEVDVEDTISVTVRYDNGAIGNWFAGSAVPGQAEQYPNGTRLIGTKGQIILGHPLRIYVEEEHPGLAPRRWHEVRVEEEPGSDRSRRIRPFAAAVLAGERPPVTGEDGREALAFILAAALIAIPILSVAGDMIRAAGGVESLFLTLAFVAIGLVLATLALIALYRVLPPSVPTWRQVQTPAAATAAALLLITRGFTLIAPRLFGANAIYGTLGAIFLGLAWLDLVFTAILVGAAWVAVRTANADAAVA